MDHQRVRALAPCHTTTVATGYHHSKLLLRHTTTKAGYNNEIVIATSTQVLGVNNDINTDPGAGPRGGEKEVHSQTNTPGISDQTSRVAENKQDQIPPGKQSQIPDYQLIGKPEKMPAGHEEEQTALIVSGIVIVTLAIWFLR